MMETLSQEKRREDLLNYFERKILRRIFDGLERERERERERESDVDNKL
jgi:hypothetical protein